MGLTANTGPYNAAAERYGVDDTIMTKIPRKKFQFSVEITVNETIPLLDESYGRKFIFHRVQGVNLPDYSYNTTSVNQYNRQRYLHTRIEPTPAGITFYDTVDNQFQNLLQAYAQHYGHGHSVSQKTILSYDTITPAFDGTFGVKPTATSERYFFPQIKIINRDTANSKREINMYNCMILNVQHDRLDYSDSAPVIWQVQIQPEHVNFDGDNSSNGASAVGVNAPTQAYNAVKSAAAGVLVNAAGEVVRDAVGNSIRLDSIQNLGTTTTGTLAQQVIDDLGQPVIDVNGNPVIAGIANPNPGNIQKAVAKWDPEEFTGIMDAFGFDVD